jgi:hypothetical protein
MTVITSSASQSVLGRGPGPLLAPPTGYPRAPRTLRGGLVRIDVTLNTVLDVVCFQYNPDSVSRTLQARAMTGEPGDRLETTRLTGPPHETIRLEAELDATDQLEHPQDPANGAVTGFGLGPALACLERLITPTVAELSAVEALFDAGSFEVAPAPAPLLLFVWGPKRIQPVAVTSLTLTEEAFDQHLNPIRAKVTIELKALTSSDLALNEPGGAVYLAQRSRSEQLAGLATGTDTRPLGVERLP